MEHLNTIIEFIGKEGIWKVIYVPGKWSNPDATVYLNSKLFYDFKGKSYSTKAAKNPTKTQAASIISEARKLVKQSELNDANNGMQKLIDQNPI